MADLFTAIVDRQYELQVSSFGIDPQNLPPARRAEYVQSMSLALIVEIGEALQEVAWKPWATTQHFNRDAYLGELIDALHFLMNLMLVATDSAEEMADAYFRKANINAQRQADGYTGLEKCSECGRER